MSPVTDRRKGEETNRARWPNSISTPPNCHGAVTNTDPDPFTSRRRFLILSLMAGWVKPERVTERIVAEVERESAI